MTLIGCFVTPHPPIMIPEVGGQDLADVYATVQSMRTLRDRVASLDPNTIVLLSPHAPLAAQQMGVSFAPSYSGSLAHFRAPGVTLSAPGDQELAQAIVDQAAINKVPTTITTSHQGPVVLDHGSMVPLVYLMGGLAQPCGLVVLFVLPTELRGARTLWGGCGRGSDWIIPAGGLCGQQRYEPPADTGGARRLRSPGG